MEKVRLTSYMSLGITEKVNKKRLLPKKNWRAGATLGALMEPGMIRQAALVPFHQPRTYICKFPQSLEVVEVFIIKILNFQILGVVATQHGTPLLVPTLRVYQLFHPSVETLLIMLFHLQQVVI